jgi:hypothetical protein
MKTFISLLILLFTLNVKAQTLLNISVNELKSNKSFKIIDVSKENEKTIYIAESSNVFAVLSYGQYEYQNVSLLICPKTKDDDKFLNDYVVANYIRLDDSHYIKIRNDGICHASIDENGNYYFRLDKSKQ